MAKRFSLIIIPEGSDRVHRLTLSRRIVWMVVATWPLLAAVALFFLYGFVNERAEYQELLTLRQENISQRHELQQMAVSLESLGSELSTLAVSEARVRMLASLDDEPDELPVAIGGLPQEDLAADDLQVQIDNLHEALELRLQRQETIRNLLNDELSITRATPDGWPTQGWLTSYFGMRKSPISGKMVIHQGLDIAANIGTPIYATADGVVASVSYSPSYGKIVKIDHGYGYRSVFAHASKILVESGQRIERGDLIAEVGNTGNSTGPHLHYELRLDGVPYDPRKTL